MTTDVLANVIREAITVATMISAPIIVLALGAGLIVSLFQAVTQIQEATLAFAPKVIAVAVACVVFGPWMIRLLAQFTTALFTALPALAR